MMWTAHKIALFPAPVRVYGVRLMPPTLGQFMTLEHLESPYVNAGIAMPDDLILAVLVCAVPYWVGVRIIRSKRLCRWACRFIAWRARRVKWQAESRTFARWLHECTWQPERIVAEDEKAGWPACAPYAYRVAYSLMDRFTERELMRMPMPKVGLYMLAKAEAAGNQFGTLAEWKRVPNPLGGVGLPEGYAYHYEDYPEIERILHPELYATQEQKQ